MTETKELFGAAEMVSEIPLEPTAIWVVVAYLPFINRGWSARPGHFTTREGADKAAKELPRVWTHRRIVRIELP